MRAALLTRVAQLFERHGFSVFTCTGTHACFDVVARRERDLFIVKALENIDGFTGDQARDLNKISGVFGAKCVLAGECAKQGPLADGVVYARHGVPALTAGTLSALVDGEYPELRKNRVVAVCLDGRKLADARMRAGYSLSQLSEAAAISREELYRYEHGLAGASEENAEKLESLLGVRLRTAIDPFADKTGSRPQDDTTVLTPLGFRSVKASSAPFEIAAEEGKTMFAGEDADARTLKKRAGIYTRISVMLDSQPCFLLEKSGRDSLAGVPVVTRSELKEIRKARELLKLLEERSE